MTEFKITANVEHKGQRLDKFLSKELAVIKPDISRSRIQSLIEDNKVITQQANNSIVNCSYKIKGNEEFVITIPAPIPTEIIPKDIKFDIVFEDENMLVINKPAGLTTHPGNGNHQNTLVNALLFYLGDNLSGINGSILYLTRF